jgi:hypothetical protein
MPAAVMARRALAEYLGVSGVRYLGRTSYGQTRGVSGSTLWVTMPEPLHRKLKVKAASSDMTMRDITLAAIRAYLDEGYSDAAA